MSTVSTWRVVPEWRSLLLDAKLSSRTDDLVPILEGKTQHFDGFLVTTLWASARGWLVGVLVKKHTPRQRSMGQAVDRIEKRKNHVSLASHPERPQNAGVTSMSWDPASNMSLTLIDQNWSKVVLNVEDPRSVRFQ